MNAEERVPCWHDFVYDAIASICYDREYVYAAFWRVYRALAEQLYGQGGRTAAGEAAAAGLKSGLDAHFSFQLEHRLNYLGANSFSLTCLIVDRATGVQKERREGLFDVSTGALLA